jgi:hypothetical protein
MGIGNLVRLKQPFRPVASSAQSFSFGVIVSLIETDSVPEVLVHLYDPATESIFTDELGVQPIYYFRLDEIVSDVIEN